MGSSIKQPAKKVPVPRQVVRNEDGVIVGTTRRSEPKILGFIKVPVRNKTAVGTRAGKTTRGRTARGKTTRGKTTRGKTGRRIVAATAGRATLRNEREARLRFANRRNAMRSNKQRRSRRTRANTAVEMREEHRVVKVNGAIRVGDLAHAMSETAGEVVRKGWTLGLEALRPLSLLEAQDARTLAAAFGWRVCDVGFDEESLTLRIGNAPRLPRAPVVTVMGHVDHGKTSLLDKIRNATVAVGEAGGITQHIGAYRVALPAGDIVFLDTPGHEAFESMRARGAQVTDIVVLVVAADDGVMPTTIEAIKHARDAGVPIVVALNKMDKPGAARQRVVQELMAHGVVDEALGGDSPVCPISAKTGEGIDALLETVLVRAEQMQLQAPRQGRAHGVVIEGRIRKGYGPTCTLIVADGTLKVGDIMVVGETWGRVRLLLDDSGTAIETAGPSTPVTVVGLQAPVGVGEHAVVVQHDAAARRITEHRCARTRQAMTPSNVVDIEAFRRRRSTKVLAVLLKGDVTGSLEAVRGVLESLVVPGVEVQVVDARLGPVSDGDIRMAAAAGALVLGFNVKSGRRAMDAARRDGVTVETRQVIYELVDLVREQMIGMLDPVIHEKALGTLEVRRLFRLSNGSIVAGCRVTEGAVTLAAQIRVTRDGTVVHEGSLQSLRTHKEAATRVGQGYECGVIVRDFDGLADGDRIEAYELVEVMPELG
ncbi:MAG: translation initiation factor IF-2 [Nannocystaceae bacterium]|nr:translation initiation factor IF-2 [Nannocystaceae bacterium]